MVGESKPSRWQVQRGGVAAWLIATGGALSIMLGVVLIPGAIDNRELAKTSLYLLGTGLLLLVVAGILAVQQQNSTGNTSAAPTLWRLITILVWAITLPQALFLGAFAMVGVLVGGLDHQDEAWDIVYPQTITSFILDFTLVTFGPWKLPAKVSVARKVSTIVPVLVTVAFWWLVRRT